MAIVYVGLGSNLNQPAQQVRSAITALQSKQQKLLALSSFYVTTSLISQQPDYINAVVAVETALSPEKFLFLLQQIEKDAGRIREAKWAPRVIDLDLILYDKQIITRPHLVVPHPEMYHRDFVLEPLKEIAPEICLPCGRTITFYLDRLDRKTITRVIPKTEINPT